MKIILLILISFSAFSQDFTQEFLRFEGRTFSNRNYADQIKESDKVLELAQRICERTGIISELVDLKDKQGNSYKAMLISPIGSSDQNKESARIFRLMGLPLIFSPYDLGRSGSMAFFDPDGSKLGVSFRFMLEGVSDYGYQHELLHAMTYFKVLKGHPTLWAGLMKITEGHYLSRRNMNAYNRFASLDETVATALSAKLEVEELMRLKRELSTSDFHRSHGKADRILNSVFHTIVAGKYLAAQSSDLAERALQTEYEIKTFPLRLGKIKKNITTTIFKLDSFTWDVVSSRGTMTPIPGGTELSLYWPRNPSRSDVARRLKLIQAQSIEAEEAFLKAEKTIGKMMSYPKLEGTNFDELEKLSKIPFGLLEN